MPRKRRPFVPPANNRDSRLIIIASEDTEATVTYFTDLASPAYYQSSKVHVEILGREDTASDPRRVLDQLDLWRNEYQIGGDDELWLVTDIDRWGNAKLSRIAQECVQKGNLLAISNPAIELWFLLHLTDVQQYDLLVQNELLENKKVTKNRTRLEQEILNVVGSYSKSNLNTDHFLPHIQAAIERAKHLDTQPESRWPQQLGTHVYRLVESIIRSSM